MNDEAIEMTCLSKVLYFLDIAVFCMHYFRPFIVGPTMNNDAECTKTVEKSKTYVQINK